MPSMPRMIKHKPSQFGSSFYSDLIKCPTLARLRMLKRKSETRSAQLDLGTQWHEAIAHLCAETSETIQGKSRAAFGEPMSLDRWLHETGLECSPFAAHIARFRRDFGRECTIRGWSIVAVETRFEFDWPKECGTEEVIPYGATVDLVVRDQQGRYAIIDFKTSVIADQDKKRTLRRSFSGDHQFIGLSLIGKTLFGPNFLGVFVVEINSLSGFIEIHEVPITAQTQAGWLVSTYSELIKFVETYAHEKTKGIASYKRTSHNGVCASHYYLCSQFDRCNGFEKFTLTKEEY